MFGVAVEWIPERGEAIFSQWKSPLVASEEAYGWQKGEDSLWGPLVP